MRTYLPPALAVLITLCAGISPPAPASSKECRDLVGLKLDHATVKSAEPIEDGVLHLGETNHTPNGYSGLPAFCRVQGLSTPVPGSEIGFEVWLPRAQNWTRRMHMVGNGAYSSRIYYAQIVPNEKLLLISRAVVASCDRLDGVADGVINDPRRCHFDLQSLRCPKEDGPSCLAPAQIEAMSRMYAGPKDVRTKKSIYTGYTFGSEGVVAGEEGESDALPGWSAYWSNPKRPTEPQRADFFRYWVFDDPHWDWWKFNWGSDIDVIDHKIGTVFNAASPNLREFESHHGKMIMFMGWQDPVGAADEAINYYDAVEATASGTSQAQRLKQTQDFLRLYMVPGMAHCAGGPGATHFSTATRDSEPPVSDAQNDMAIALEEWVEHGVAPHRLIATKFDKEHGSDRHIVFQRPLCVYPQVARYQGGPTNSASSFACVEIQNALELR